MFLANGDDAISLVIADGAAAVSPDTSLILGIFSGLVSIAVAYIAYLGLKHSRSEPEPTPMPTEPPAPEVEPRWVTDLRNERDEYKRQHQECSAEVDRLEQVCIDHRINPKTGLMIGEQP